MNEECGLSKDGSNIPLSMSDDLSLADDITRRFEQLERQWLSFRKRGPCLESGKEALATTAAQVSTAIICTETSSVAYEVQPSASGAIKTDQHDSYFNQQSRSSPDTTRSTEDKPDECLTDSRKQFCKMPEEKEHHTLCENNCVFGEGNNYKPCMECFQNVRTEVMCHKSQFKVGSNAVETGVVILDKLCMALKDILKQLEFKDKILRETWNEIRESSKLKHKMKLDTLGFKPDFSFEIGDTGLEGISLLAEGMSVDNWSNVITTICKHLLTYMNKETELQQWAISLEEIAVKLLKMEEDFVKAKASVAEQSRRADMLMKNAEESSHMAKEERESLARERENLGQWITHLQEQQKIVSECEKEATLSLTEVQKRAAELSARESSVDANALEISSLKEEIRVATLQLQEEQASLKKERLLTREKMELVEAKEKEAQYQLLNMEKMQQEIKFEREQLEKERISQEQERQKSTLLTKETEERLTVKERMLNDIERDLEGKVLAAEAMTKKLNSREKLLKNFQKQIEEERFQTRELITKLEHEKKNLDNSKREADEAWVNIAQERESTAAYIKNADEKTKLWEERLKAEENELQQQQKVLRELKNQFKGEQENYQELKKKWLKEQELVAEELKSREDALNKEESTLELEKQQFKIDLENLAADKLIAAEAVRKLAEKDAKMEALEKELQKWQQEHILQVEAHENEYKGRLQDLETIEKHLQQRNFEVERRYQEVRLGKKELKQWKKEAEAALDSQIEGFIKEKEDLNRQNQKLANARMEIEQAGAYMIDHMMKLDKASTKLENLRHQLDSMQEKLRLIVESITYKQRTLKEKEIDLCSKEIEMVSTQNLLKDMEYSLKNENQSLQTRLVEFEKQAAAFEQKTKDQLQALAQAENALAMERSSFLNSVEERESSIQREKLLIEENKVLLLAKEKNLETAEECLKKREDAIEEKNMSLMKLEQQVRVRLQKVGDIENQSRELKNGLTKLKEEQDSLANERSALKLATDSFHKASLIQTSEFTQLKVKQEEEGNEEEESKEWLRQEIEKEQKGATGPIAKFHARESNISLCESRVAQKESAIIEFEQKRDKIEKDTQALLTHTHLFQAHEDLEAERKHLAERQQALQGLAITLDEKEIKLREKEKDIVKREDFVRCLSKKIPSSACDLANKAASQINHGSIVNDLSSPNDSLTHQNMKFEKAIEGTGVNRKIDHGGYISTERYNYTECAAKSVGEQRFCNMGETDAWVNETENLKVQHHQLEETRRAIEVAKSTLGAQLKATKQMVYDASLAAQKTSRERVALEEERRLLAKVRKEMEISIASRERKLSLEAKQLESLRTALELEKAQAMQIIQKSEQQKKSSHCYESNTNKTYYSENCLGSARSGASVSPAEDSHYCEESPSKAQSIRSSSLICQTCSDIQHRSLLNAENERSSDLEHGTASLWDGLDCTKLKWEEMQDNSEINNLQGNSILYFENEMIEPKEGYLETQLVTAPCKEEQRTTLQCSGSIRPRSGIADMSSHSTLGNAFDKDDYWRTNTSLGIEEQMIGTMEKYSSSMVNVLQKSHGPSQKRLENVMESLGRARKASRNRLQRTEIAISAFPAASADAADVKQALEVLASRLNSMEQMEDELAYQLVAAYASNPPDSEGMLVDKVQLLCRMEEQQTLRAEWEEEMQKQLEKISSLQTMPCAPLCLSTPVKQTVYDRPYSRQSLKESSRFTASESWQSQCHTFDRVPHDPNQSCEFNNSMHMSFPLPPEWNLSQDCSQEVNTKSFSPHIHKYGPPDNSNDNLPENQLDRVLCAKETNVRRRLHLSIP